MGIFSGKCLLLYTDSRFDKPWKGSKGFNWVVRICCLVRWFEVWRISILPWKVLIVAVWSCGCGVLIRGLRNLGASGKGTGLFFSRVRKEPKVHQRFANLWTPGTIQIAGRYGVFVKMTGIHQVTGFAKSCNFAGYRRQWFESVRGSGFTA